MSLRSNRPPKYRQHKPSGQAVVTLCGHDHYLGKWQSTESKAEYDRLIAEWLANGRHVPGRQGGHHGLSVNEVEMIVSADDELTEWEQCLRDRLGGQVRGFRLVAEAPGPGPTGPRSHLLRQATGPARRDGADGPAHPGQRD